jgi:hypothetical protein
MSYLHPAYYRLLPATARPQLIAFLQLVERNAHASSDGWADVRQTLIAQELGRTVRAVKRWVLVCSQAGILEVQHGQRNNRSRLRLVSAKTALARNPNPSQRPIREWGHARPHSGDTDVPSVEKSHPYPRARSDRGDLLRSQTPRPAAPAEAGSARREIPTRTLIRLGKVFDELDVGQRNVRKAATLCRELLERTSERELFGYLAIVKERVGGRVDGHKRAKGVLAMLEARLRKLRERSGKRFGAHDSA